MYGLVKWVGILIEVSDPYLGIRVFVLKVGSYAIEKCESGQAGNGAAINNFFYVP